jgi:hypothetical protein
MTKKLYFLDVSSLNDEETHTSLSNEEFKKRAEIVYDSIDSYSTDVWRYDSLLCQWVI